MNTTSKNNSSFLGKMVTCNIQQTLREVNFWVSLYSQAM